MCDTNWTQLLRGYEKDFGKWFTDTRTKKDLFFIGLLHGKDDYYFAMATKKGKIISYSCVANMEQNSLVKKEGEDEG